MRLIPDLTIPGNLERSLRIRMNNNTVSFFVPTSDSDSGSVSVSVKLLDSDS